MSLIELPRRKAAPRFFIEPPEDMERRVSRALEALGNLPEGIHLPGLIELADALICIADELACDTDLEEDELGDDEALPLFAFASGNRL